VRQGQQNRRGRGRNNNRKGQNPLARSFESNGPDVKIRGTPAHIAEKYLSLARDAQTSSDPVLAENYLQHAEHYNRIIMAYREQLQQSGELPNGSGQHMPDGAQDFGDGGGDGDDMGDDMGDDGFQPPMPHQSQPPVRQQGSHEGHREGNRDNSRDGNRDNNRDGNRENRDGNRHDRPFRRDHGGGRHRGYNADRDRRPEGRGPPADRQAEGRGPPPERQQEGDGEGRRPPPERSPERFQQEHEQPEFLRRPIRRARTENEDPGKDEPSGN
jgi:hypothetical protein